MLLLPVSALMSTPLSVSVGAVLSSTYAVRPLAAPSLPAASATLNTMLLLPASTAPVQLMTVPLAMLLMSVQIAPLSTEPYRMSPSASAPLSVALIVCAAVRVRKSVLLLPVSALMSTRLTVSVGASRSSTSRAPIAWMPDTPAPLVTTGPRVKPSASST